MAVPKFYEFMKPALIVISDGKEYKRRELYELVSNRMGLSEDEKEELLPSGLEQTYINRISWAFTYLKKANLVKSPARSVFQITDLGLSVLEKNPKIITPKFLRQFESFREFQTISNSENNRNEQSETLEVESDDSPQEVLDKAFKTISISLVDEVLQEIMNQTPEFFERLVVKVLVSLGYGGSKIGNTKVLGKSGDEGIDGVIKEDKLGFDEIYIQAKRWDVNSTIGRPEIQKFLGALAGRGATKGAFITTARFSKEAKEYIEKHLSQKIVLIDGNMLASLMIENNVGVSIETTYHIKSIDRDFFEEE